MKIKTTEFSVTKKEYMRLLITHFRKRRWWLWLIIISNIFVSLIMIAVMKSSLNLFLFATGFAVLYFGSFFIGLYWHVNRKSAAAVYETVRFEFYDDNIHTYIGKDNGVLKCSQIIRTYKLKDFYMLYIAEGQFLMLPFYCFGGDNNIAEFDKWLLKNKMIKK